MSCFVSESLRRRGWCAVVGCTRLETNLTVDALVEIDNLYAKAPNDEVAVGYNDSKGLCLS